jgi:hypothetical protein
VPANKKPVTVSYTITAELDFALAKPHTNTNGRKKQILLFQAITNLISHHGDKGTSLSEFKLRLSGHFFLCVGPGAVLTTKLFFFLVAHAKKQKEKESPPNSVHNASLLLCDRPNYCHPQLKAATKKALVINWIDMTGSLSNTLFRTAKKKNANIAPWFVPGWYLELLELIKFIYPRSECSLYISNLSRDVAEQELANFLSQFGLLCDIHFPEASSKPKDAPLDINITVPYEEPVF